MSTTLITKNEVSSETSSLSLEVNSERLKHIFYMLHGETTTRSRPFKGAIQVSKGDVEILINDICEQLELAHVRDKTILVGVGFDKDFIEKPFSEFQSYNWNEPDKTKEITIKVSFLYEDFDSGNPLKHSIFIRISKGIRPGNLLQLMASNDSEQLDNLENLMCPVFCRTDHVNDKLSKDIMRVVEDWHAGQKQPQLLSGGYEFLKKHKTQAARVVHYSFPTAAVFALAYCAFSIPDIITEEKYVLPTFVTLIIVAKLVLSVLMNIGGARAQKVYSKIGNISGDDVIFDITKGDDKEQSDTINKNTALFKESRSIFLWTNAQAVIASLIAAGIFEWLKP